MREYAVLFQDLATFVSLDDKHHIKVGEPNYPVGAAVRGRCVLVAPNQTFEVGDHDFTKFAVVPSVSFVLKFLTVRDMKAKSTLGTKMQSLSYRLLFDMQLNYVRFLHGQLTTRVFSFCILTEGLTIG